MKRRITRKQWKLAPIEIRRKFKRFRLPDIADLIEYLGIPHISAGGLAGISVHHDRETYFGDELVDALWNAVLKEV